MVFVGIYTSCGCVAMAQEQAETTTSRNASSATMRFFIVLSLLAAAVTAVPTEPQSDLEFIAVGPLLV